MRFEWHILPDLSHNSAPAFARFASFGEARASTDERRPFRAACAGSGDVDGPACLPAIRFLSGRLTPRQRGHGRSLSCPRSEPGARRGHQNIARGSAGESEWLARFRREARTLAALNHPNIAVVHGLEESDGVHYLIMELVEGDTLAERAVRLGPLPVQDAVSLCTQVVEALEAAHHKSIIHRDIKPANIKVTPEGRVKVLDFGLAKRSVHAGGGADTTMTGLSVIGSIAGTPGYMSPEQARGKEVDQRTDIWAVGCVLFELLTSRRTFDGETVNDTLAAVWNGTRTRTSCRRRRRSRFASCFVDVSERSRTAVSDHDRAQDRTIRGSAIAGQQLGSRQAEDEARTSPPGGSRSPAGAADGDCRRGLLPEAGARAR